MANASGGNRRSRNRDDPKWDVGSLADNVSARQRDVVMDIPKDKVGLIIGKKRRRLQNIKKQSGAYVDIKDYKVHLRGTPEQCERARKIIEDILDPVSKRRLLFRKVGDALSKNEKNVLDPLSLT